MADEEERDRLLGKIREAYAELVEAQLASVTMADPLPDTYGPAATDHITRAYDLLGEALDLYSPSDERLMEIGRRVVKEALRGAKRTDPNEGTEGVEIDGHKVRMTTEQARDVREALRALREETRRRAIGTPYARRDTPCNPG